MNKFTKANLGTIRADIDKALAEVAKKHSISLDLGNISFEANKFSVKLTSTIGDGSEYEKTNFERKCFVYDIPKDWFGKTFKADGRTFEITGINTRASKSPINFKDVKTNASYKASASYVKTCMK
jgi:hypothetical protein